MATRKIDGKAYSIGEILKKGIQYRVPTYQRDFAWSSDQVESLWDDIINAINNDKKEYFLGAIVTSQTEEVRKRDIVDGQQRLTALSMIFASIVDKWKERGDITRSSLVKSAYLGDVDIRTLSVSSKLTLNENNDAFYQLCVINGENITAKDKRSLITSNKLIIEGYEKTKFLLKEWIDKEQANESEKLLKLEEFISDGIYAILIETGDESDAFITFETLNDRGLELATSDLVKNLLFSKAGASNINLFKKKWNEVVFIVGSDALTQFIRYFWNAYYGVAREKELYKSIKETIKETSDAKYMIERLRKVADYHDALSNTEHSYWLEFTNDYKQYLKALSLFKVSQYRPIALAAMGNMKPADLTKVLNMMVVISFRYTVISGLNTGNLEKVYSSTALAISKKPEIRPKEIFNLLKAVYVDDNKFESDFKQKYFNKENIARYILREINNEAMSNNELQASEKSTLEHILPKNPSQDWNKYINGKKPEELVYLIGNLTLLEESKNREIGNSNFDIKKQRAFNTSNLALNDDVKEQLYWSSQTIETRSAKLAKLASRCWRLDY